MIPQDYVKLQYLNNYVHKDGSVEGCIEPSTLVAHWVALYAMEQGLPHRSVLDAGCRTGYVLDTFSCLWPNATVVGCDVVPEFVEYGIRKGRNCEVADMHDLPYATRRFDWVFCAGSIEHCYDVPLACSELRRVSNVAMFISADTAGEGEFSANPSHFTRYSTRREWIDACGGQGWSLVHLNVPRHDNLDMLWLRDEWVEHLGRGMEWYRSRLS